MTNDLSTTSASTTSARGPSAGRAAWRRYIPAAAGVAYLAAWVAGLSIWPVNLALNATAAQEAASHAAHPAEAATQYLLAEGLAGLLLAVVLGCALLPRLRVRAGRRLTVSAVIFGAVAVAVSLTQCVLGVVLTVAAVDHHVSTSGELFRLLNRLDGVKMFALAITAVSLAALNSPRPVLPRWLRGTAVLLAVALAASGYAYLSLDNSLGWTAYVSGVLLLIWVTGTGIALTVQRRR
jgi:glucan phosphoethanolaminetransferase (alkaline phosphatase superfamily)